MQILNIDKICVGYEQKQIIKEISLSINEGDFITIIGPNGSGKSTFLKALSRNLKLKKGQVLFSGKDIFKLDTKFLAKYIAVLNQGSTAPDDLVVKDLVSYGRYPHKKWWVGNNSEDKKVVELAMAQTRTTQFAERHLNTLSGGERQRAWIAMALAQKPKVFLLDEPTTFLDIAHQIEVMELMTDLNQNHGLTIISVVHDIQHAAYYSKRIVLLDQGDVVAYGEPREVITQENLRQVFGVETYINWDTELGRLLVRVKGLAKNREQKKEKDVVLRKADKHVVMR